MTGRLDSLERTALVVAVCGALIAVALLAAMGKLFPAMDDRTTVTTPEGMCPQEDSCDADYRDGGWHIVEVTP